MSKFSPRQFVNHAKLLIGIGAVILMMNLLACRQSASLEPKTRPSGVPGDAIWAGGADGGAYVRCTVDVIHDVNLCTVWNDYTGGSIGPGKWQRKQVACLALNLRPLYHHWRSAHHRKSASRTSG